MEIHRKDRAANAARNRRKNENDQFHELAHLLNAPCLKDGLSSISKKPVKELDKASILRLAIEYMRYQNLYRSSLSTSSKPKTSLAKSIDENLSQHFMESLDGFIFVVSHNGNFIYVSETVEKCLGLRQLDLIGTSSYDIIHPDHHSDFLELLSSPFKPNMIPSTNCHQMGPREKAILISFDINMRCNVMKRGTSAFKSSAFKLIHVTGQIIPFKNDEQSYGLVAFGQPLLPPTINELRLDSKVFVSRVGMDLKIAFCEGKIRKFMKFTAKDIVGMCAYNFYHENDMAIVGDAHTDCIDTGKCVSRVYRWMNKTGGWVWMQTVGTVISRKTSKGEEKQILCVNYISSEIEHENEIVHAIQLKFKQLAIREQQSADNFDDFGLDGNGPVVPSTEDLNSQNTETADKESYIKSITHYNKYRPINISDEPVKPNPQIFGTNPMPITNSYSQLSSDEESLCRNTDRLGTLQLIEELKANPLPPMYDEFPLSPATCCSLDMITPIDFTNSEMEEKVFPSNNNDCMTPHPNFGFNDMQRPRGGTDTSELSDDCGIPFSPTSNVSNFLHGMDVPSPTTINVSQQMEDLLLSLGSIDSNNNNNNNKNNSACTFSLDYKMTSPHNMEEDIKPFHKMNGNVNASLFPSSNEKLIFRQEPVDTMDVDGSIPSQSLHETGNHECINSANLLNLQQTTSNGHRIDFGVDYLNELDFSSPEIGENLQTINNRNLSSFNLNMQTNNMNPYIQSPLNMASYRTNYSTSFQENKSMQAYNYNFKFNSH